MPCKTPIWVHVDLGVTLDVEDPSKANKLDQIGQSTEVCSFTSTASIYPLDLSSAGATLIHLYCSILMRCTNELHRLMIEISAFASSNLPGMSSSWIGETWHVKRNGAPTSCSLLYGKIVALARVIISFRMGQ